VVSISSALTLDIETIVNGTAYFSCIQDAPVDFALARNAFEHLSMVDLPKWTPVLHISVLSRGSAVGLCL
jgi:hypothetical protein